MTGSGPDLAEHRHAELVEQLRRANAGLEALHRLGERQLSEMRNVTARMEGALQFVVRAWPAIVLIQPNASSIRFLARWLRA